MSEVCRKCLTPSVYLLVQEAVKNDEGGKVRGLFCALPKQGVFSLSVYGLHPRETFSAVTSSSAVDPSSDPPHHGGGFSPSKGRPVRDRATAPSSIPLSRNLFEWSWFCYPPLDSHKSQQSADHPPLVRGIGTAMKLSTHGSPSLATSSSSFLRFARSSTPNDILHSKLRGSSNAATAAGDETSISQEGCHIALCRVLLSKVMNISGKLDTAHFIEASRLGYDAIFIEDR